jgi:hypothetical protein
MYLTFLLAGAVLASPRLSPAEQKFLTRIHHATSQLSDKKAAFLQFNKEVTEADAQRCRQLQNRVPANSEAYVELGFVQAYYGLDYAVNLRRALRPYWLWHTDVQRMSREYHYDANAPWTDLDSVPLILNLLYLRHHDVQSLGTWLDVRLDGEPAEVNADTLAELWKRHQHAMLLACDGHPHRLDNLAELLEFSAITDDGNRARYNRSKKQFLSTLQPLLGSSDPRIARTARELKKRIVASRMAS